MMQNLENIDRFFNEQLHDYSEKPRPEVWEKIMEKTGRRKKRTGVLFISRMAAGIALLFSLSIAINYFTRDVQNKVTITANNPVTEEKAEASAQQEIIKPESISTTQKDHSEKNYFPEKESRTLADVPVSRENNIVPLSDTLSEPTAPAPEEMMYLSEKLIPVDGLIEKKKPAEQILSLPENSVSDSALLYAYLMQDNVFSDDGESKKKERWMLGGQFGPVYTSDEFSTSSSEYLKDQVNSKKSGTVTYAGGINVAYSAGKRLSIQSGVHYSKYGRNANELELLAFIPNQDAIYNNDNVNSGEWRENSAEGTYVMVVSTTVGKIRSNSNNSNYMFNDNQSALSNVVVFENVDEPPTGVVQYFEYIELPLNLRYKLIDKKLDFNIMGGISTNFLVSNKAYADFNHTLVPFTETDQTRKINYNCQAGFGIEYPVFKEFVFSIEPRFRYSINPVYRQDIYSEHPYSFGVFTGITYSF